MFTKSQLVLFGYFVLACHSGEERTLQLVSSEAGLGPHHPDASVDAGGSRGQEPTGGSGNGGAAGNTTLRDAEAGPGDPPGDMPETEPETGPPLSCDGGTSPDAQCNDRCDAGCEATQVTELALGQDFGCALFEAGTVKCWGSNGNGVLTSAGPATTLLPHEAPVLDFGTNARVTSISAGRDHACALFNNGQARCWGNGEYGKTGRGSTEKYGDEASETLAALPDLNLQHVIQVSAGRSTTCALQALPGGTRSIHCWGIGVSRGNGQTEDYGDNEAIDDSSPVTLTAIDGDGGQKVPMRLETSHATACALMSDGSVYCWGSNSAGKAGLDISILTLPVPTTAVANLSSDIEEISGFHVNTCARAAAGQFWCWGTGDNGRVGYPGGNHVYVPPAPVNVGIAASQIAMGQAHGCFVDDEGAVRCWGNGAYGALGYGTDDSIGLNQDPADAYATLPNGGRIDLGDYDGVPGWDKAVRVYAGWGTSCAVMESGTVRCWGTNTYGQAGYDRAHSYIGLTETPAEAYQALGIADVQFF
jgi:alpha-tubulin suppressor-like RCC1 family protein